ncbi:MAG TPA: ATP-binding protein, partial [Gemmatimonadota bacterium]|nr:ATP-binding protein [Gemmatimonadota bacterium]
MLATIPSAALVGLDVVRVRVEVAITRGTPMIQVVGLPESAVREGRERIRAAAARLGLHVPGLRITVNLAPAGLRKHGAAFDLPILVGILAAWGELPSGRCGRWLLAGELGLDGSLRPVRGALAIALHARRAADVDGVILPAGNLAEARAVDGMSGGGPSSFRVLGAADLGQVVAFLERGHGLPRARDLPGGSLAPPSGDGPRGDPGSGPGDGPAAGRHGSPSASGPDLADVRGQSQPRRALEIAAAGGHSLLLRGEPGAGKTLLARCLPGLLPPLGLDEAVEVTTIHSVAGLLPPGSGLVRRPPFRAPHHGVSAAGLLGGGSPPRPGELSLAHRGVLFLDELPEFGRPALEGLRQPLEAGHITLVRARHAVTFPCRIQLVAAMNPCPCGRRTAAPDECTCDPPAVRRYKRRVSGP